MGCPTEIEIDDNLVFSVTTHDLATNVLTDADAVPDYWIYEDETGTVILSGSMAKLDDTNTTGFYSELIACTSGNGFEHGKSYSIYIEIVVSAATRGVSYGFKAYDPRATKAQLDQIASTITAIYNSVNIRQVEVNDSGATTTKFITTLTETINGFWNRAAILFTSGNNEGLIRGIKNYTSATKELQLQTPLSYIPANGDNFSIVPARKFLTPDVLELTTAVWNEDLTSYNISASAGKSMQCILYGNAVIYNSTSGNSGTTFPTGTQSKPVDNLTDALSIMNTRGIDRLFLQNSITIGAAHDISNKAIETIGIMGTDVTLISGCIANNTVFRHLNLQGTVSNGDQLLVEACQIMNLNNFTGIMNNVAFGQGSEISVGTWATVILGTAGGEPTNEIEINIGTASLSLSNWTGNLKLIGKTGTNRTSINCTSGNIIIDSTCTAGIIQMLGVGIIEADNSGAGCTVDTDGFISSDNISKSVWDEELANHINTETTGHALMQNTYDNRVFIDPINGSNTTIYPGGTRQHPIKIIADALTIANTYDLSIIHIIGNLTISGGEVLDGFTFTSDRSLSNSITITNASTINTFFDNLTVGGTLNGSVRFTFCVLDTITGFTGGAKNSLLISDIALTTTNRTYFTEVDSFIDVIDDYIGINVGISHINMIRCHGNYEIKNKTGTDRTYIGLNAGKIKIASTCTAGSIFVTGNGEIIDNSGAGCTVNSSTLISPNYISDAVWEESQSEHVAFDTMGESQDQASNNEKVSVI